MYISCVHNKKTQKKGSEFSVWIGTTNQHGHGPDGCMIRSSDSECVCVCVVQIGEALHLSDTGLLNACLSNKVTKF